MTVSPHLSWNLVEDVRQMLSYAFMVNALRAGTIVAVVAGAVGYLMVLRGQSFAGHTLAVVGFPGAAGAVWLGITPTVGFYAFCVAAAVAVALLPGTARAGVGARADEGAVIGTVQAFALACGYLFISLSKDFVNGTTTLLFGSVYGVSSGQVGALAVAGVLVLAALAGLGRPLLFATVDPAVARARGVPVRLLGVAFLLLLGVAAAGTSQVTGSLLVFALLVAPAAAAVRLTARPAVGLALAVALAVLVTWLGETAAFYWSGYPPGFWVATFAFAAFVLAAGARGLAARAGAR